MSVGSGATTAAGGGEKSPGFWADLGSAVGEGVKRIGSTVLPIWFAETLKAQTSDQLSDPLYQQNTGNARSDGPTSFLDQTLFSVAGRSVSNGAAIGVGVALVLTVVLLRMK